MGKKILWETEACVSYYLDSFRLWKVARLEGEIPNQ
jgi:hypothetical protein